MNQTTNQEENPTQSQGCIGFSPAQGLHLTT